MELHVLGPLRNDLDDTGPTLDKRVRDGLIQLASLWAPERCNQRLGQRCEVDPMWRPEQLLAVGRQVRLGEKREDAATVVVDDDDRDPQRMQAGRHERVEVVEERQVANDE